MCQSSGPSRMRHLRPLQRSSRNRCIETHDDNFYGNESDDDELHTIRRSLGSKSVCGKSIYWIESADLSEEFSQNGLHLTESEYEGEPALHASFMH